METLDEAVRLRSPDLRGPVLDVLELQEELVGGLSGRPQYSRPLSLRMVRIFTPCSSKKGSTWLFRIWTPVTGILLV